MRNTLRMQVLNAMEYLCVKFGSFLLSQFVPLHNVVEQFAPARILHDQVDVLSILNYFEELYEGGVLDLP